MENRKTRYEERGEKLVAIGMVKEPNGDYRAYDLTYTKKDIENDDAPVFEQTVKNIQTYIKGEGEQIDRAKAAGAENIAYEKIVPNHDRNVTVDEEGDESDETETAAKYSMPKNLVDLCNMVCDLRKQHGSEVEIENLFDINLYLVTTDKGVHIEFK